MKRKTVLALLLAMFSIALRSYPSVLNALDPLTIDSIQLTNNLVDDFGPSICHDSQGNPHIAWVRGQASSYEVYYGERSGASWDISRITSLSSASMFHVSLCVDKTGNPHIAALTETSRWDLWYMSWDLSTSAWIVESVANGGYDSHRNVVSMAIDKLGSPHIAWAARRNGLWGVFYAVKTGGAWSIETVSHNDDSAPSIALDSNDEPHVVWTNVDYLRNPRLQYASRVNGNWVKEEIAGAERGGGDNPRQLAMDSARSPHIAFCKTVSPSHYELWYGTKIAGAWSLSLVRDPTFDNWHPSISLSDLGTPYIAWRSNDAGNLDVYLAKKTLAGWEVYQITDGTANEGGNPGPTMSIDSDDDVHISWYSPLAGTGAAEIYYKEWPTRPSTYANLDIDPNSLNLGSKGNTITAYVGLQHGFDVRSIQVSSIFLNDTIPVASYAPSSIGDYDSDGDLELMVKFDRNLVINYILAHMPNSARFMTVTFTVTGYLNDGTAFKGSDTTKVIFSKPIAK